MRQRFIEQRKHKQLRHKRQFRFRLWLRHNRFRQQFAIDFHGRFRH
jgi:hypothetical protein